MRKAIILSFGLLALIGNVNASANVVPAESGVVSLSASVKHYLGGRIAATVETAQFSCSDRVYATVYLPQLPVGEHQLEFTWFGPDSSLQQRIRDQLTVMYQARDHYLSRWISFDRGGAAAMVSLFDPSLGYEAFVGQWSVQVRINRQLMVSKEFNVLC